jgi:hypothetical protein
MIYDQYPPRLRAVLKAAPAFFMILGMGALTRFTLYASIHRPEDHIPKQRNCSSLFERGLRSRDDQLRFRYQHLISWDPNRQTTGVQESTNFALQPFA